MVADAIECLTTQVEWYENHLCPPNRMVVALLDVGVECILRCVTARPMAAVMAQGDRFR